MLSVCTPWIGDIQTNAHNDHNCCDASHEWMSELVNVAEAIMKRNSHANIATKTQVINIKYYGTENIT